MQCRVASMGDGEAIVMQVFSERESGSGIEPVAHVVAQVLLTLELIRTHSMNPVSFWHGLMHCRRALQCMLVLRQGDDACFDVCECAALIN